MSTPVAVPTKRRLDSDAATESGRLSKVARAGPQSKPAVLAGPSGAKKPIAKLPSAELRPAGVSRGSLFERSANIGAAQTAGVGHRQATQSEAVPAAGPRGDGHESASKMKVTGFHLWTEEKQAASRPAAPEQNPVLEHTKFADRSRKSLDAVFFRFTKLTNEFERTTSELVMCTENLRKCKANIEGSSQKLVTATVTLEAAKVQFREAEFEVARATVEHEDMIDQKTKVAASKGALEADERALEAKIEGISGRLETINSTASP